MINISCPCLFPLIIIKHFDDGDELVYYAIPEDEDMRRPLSIDIVEQDGEDYVGVMWRKPTDDDNIKMYEVNSHIVYAGCSSDEATIKNGRLSCEEKDLFLVLHPVDEWVNEHIIDIKEK